MQVVLPPLPPWQTQEEAWVDALCFTTCCFLLFWWNTIWCFTLICWTLSWRYKVIQWWSSGKLCSGFLLQPETFRQGNVLPRIFHWWSRRHKSQVERTCVTQTNLEDMICTIQSVNQHNLAMWLMNHQWWWYFRAKWYSRGPTFPFTVDMATTAESSL